MQINDLLSSDRTLYVTGSCTKKRILELISTIFCQSAPVLDQADLFDAFIARERLGSTDIGHGVALPHVRSANLKQPLGALLHTQTGINFEGPSDAGVDLFFALIVPETATEAHLQILAILVEMFNQVKFRQALRRTQDTQSLYEAIQSYAYLNS